MKPKIDLRPSSRFSSTEIPKPETDPAKQTPFNTPAYMRQGKQIPGLPKAPREPVPGARPSERPNPEHPGVGPNEPVPMVNNPMDIRTPAWLRRGVKPPVEEAEVEESGLQAYLGKKKYGDEGMKALQKAGREGASKEKMALIRAKYDKLDEQDLAEARLLGQEENGNRAVKIYRDTVWNEYIVHFYLNGEHQDEADYHTDDKEDAKDTARHWLKSGNPGTSSTAVSESLMNRVVKNLVRIQDIVENKKVYGGLDTADRRLIVHSIKESMRGGLSFEDALTAMVEEFKQNISEVGTIGTVGTVGANPATTAPGAPAKPGTTANAAPAAQSTVKSEPMSSQGIEALGQVLKNAGLTPGQLSTVVSKART